MCCSPDFTHPDAEFRREQIEKEKFWIDMTAAMGGRFCRVLSGQRRPELSREQGIAFAAQCIDQCATVRQQSRCDPDHRKSLQGRLLDVSRVCAKDGRLL